MARKKRALVHGVKQSDDVGVGTTDNPMPDEEEAA